MITINRTRFILYYTTELLTSKIVYSVVFANPITIEDKLFDCIYGVC